MVSKTKLKGSKIKDSKIENRKDKHGISEKENALVYADYNMTEEVIANMLTENTGVHFMDSGGESGRSWQRNQGRDFKKEDPAYIDDDEYGTIGQSLFHYLAENVEITDESEAYEDMLDKVAEDNPDEPYWQDILMFKEQLAESGETISDDTWVGKDGTSSEYNTFNEPYNTLDQDYQGFYFYNGDQYYLVISVHGGADIRGGYGTPRVFKISEMDRFVLSNQDGNLVAKDGSEYYTDDAGNHWYSRDNDDEVEWSEIKKKGVKQVSGY